jgi:prepilin-type N-terminal cleavage/methylation domain-containing protein
MALPKTSIHSGFTLIEFLVVMSVMLVVFSMGLILSLDSYRGYSFRNERNLAVSVLQKARSRALANIDQQPQGVHVDTTGNQYVIFEGSYSPGASTNINIPFIMPGLSHSGMNDILFNQLDASVTSVPSAWHFSDTAHTSDISFNSEGQISWTN